MKTVRVVSKRKIKRFILIVVIGLVLITIISLLLFYFLNLKRVNSSNEIIPFEVKENDTYYTLGGRLKNNNLIKNELVYKIYLKLHKQSDKLDVGMYPLAKNMGVKKIIETLKKGPSDELTNNKITFREGLNIRHIVDLMAKETKYSKEEINQKISNQTYLKTLINKYWFLTDEILNKDIYYPLEGYLYPDTYQFKNDDSIEDIINAMLDNTLAKLKPYQTIFNNQKYTVHQVLTLASIVELEASTKEDRKGVAGVFYNRLNKNMGLESDVTTYYGLKKELTDSIKGKVYDYTPYNTRNTSLKGKLPIGPICNPSIDSIDAVLNYTKSNYYYFVADTSKKVYFAKTYNEHLNIIKKLKEQGKWNA